MSNFKNIPDIVYYFKALRFNGVMWVRGLKLELMLNCILLNIMGPEQ